MSQIKTNKYGEKLNTPQGRYRRSQNVFNIKDIPKKGQTCTIVINKEQVHRIKDPITKELFPSSWIVIGYSEMYIKFQSVDNPTLPPIRVAKNPNLKTALYYIQPNT